jgi:hypothetical protein
MNANKGATIDLTVALVVQGVSSTHNQQIFGGFGRCFAPLWVETTMRHKRSEINWGERASGHVRQFGWMMLVFLAGAGASHSFRSVPVDMNLVSKAETRPGLDYFVAPQTFSEIQNAKNLVNGLANQLASEVESKRAEDLKTAVLLGAAGASLEPHLLAEIKALEQGVKEFESTDEDYYVKLDLLLFLKKAGLWHRWVETYLKILYRHPTSRVIADFATEAIAAGRASGREKEIIDAFRHLTSIPKEFDGKVQIQAALISHNMQNQLTQSDTHGTAGETLTCRPDVNFGAP